jgi:hypothetical protein
MFTIGDMKESLPKTTITYESGIDDKNNHNSVLSKPNKILNNDNDVSFDTVYRGRLTVFLTKKNTDSGWNYVLICKNKSSSFDTISIQSMELSSDILYGDFVGDFNNDLLFYTVSGSGSIPYFVMFQYDKCRFVKIYQGDGLFLNDTSNRSCRFEKISIVKRRIRITEMLYSLEKDDAMCCPSGGKRMRYFRYNEKAKIFVRINDL